MYRFTDSSAPPISLPLPKISEEIMRSLSGSRIAFSCPSLYALICLRQPRTQSRWMLQGPQGPQIPLPSHKPLGPRGPQVPLPSHKPPGAPGVIARSLIQGLPSAVSRIPPPHLAAVSLRFIFAFAAGPARTWLWWTVRAVAIARHVRSFQNYVPWVILRHS